MSSIFQIPANKYELSRLISDSKQNFERLKLLVHHAIDGLREKTEYELCDEVFDYGAGESEIGSHYGLNFHIHEKVCVVFSTQRDVAYPIALFPLTRSHEAVEYFVWLVSDGKAKIDWSLFLDMEP